MSSFADDYVSAALLDLLHSTEVAGVDAVDLLRLLEVSFISTCGVEAFQDAPSTMLQFV